MEAAMGPNWRQTLYKVVMWILFCACVYGLLEVLCASGNWLLRWGQPKLQPACQLDNEGQWSIGIYRGKSPFELKPIELVKPRVNTPSAWPVANPVFTCAHVTDVPSSFVADPFIWPSFDNKVYLFYETKSQHNMQGDIGAAVSSDGGASFKHLGVVLDEPWHLSYPFVFEHEGQMYMMPEGSTSGTLRLYRAESFPIRWTLDKVLINEPLIDASLVHRDGLWWIFASNRHQRTSKNCRELEIWYSSALKGNWTLHPQSPVKAGVQGARCAGRPVVYNGQLYRWGQDCTYTYGHRVLAFRVTTLNTTHFKEEEVPLSFDPQAPNPRPNAWNGVRYHHLDPHQLPNGDWLASMDGDSVVSDYLTWRAVARAAVLLPLAVAIAAVVTAVQHLGGTQGTLQKLWELVLGLWGWLAIKAWMVSVMISGQPLRPAYKQLPIWQQTSDLAKDHANGSSGGSGSSSNGGAAARAAGDNDDTRRKAASYSARQALEGLHWRLNPYLGRRLLLGITGWHVLYWTVGIVVSAILLAWFVWTFCRLQILAFLLWYIEHSGGSPDPIRVDGQVSKLSVVVMTYEARKITLQAFVKHYSRCSSVGEIVVVWNKGTPPDPERDFDSQVPIHIRVEAKNSMNNRFQPDNKIQNRAVLLLDDDIIMPCSDIERGFARWRQHPERITGYYARILEGDPPQYQCTQCEKHTYDSGVYNVILAGASILDKDLVFEAYSSHDNAAGREYVDKVFNCDDLLLNYLMAHKLGSTTQYVEYVRPTKRLDVGKLTSARLSTGNFGPVRHKCTEDFARMFGNPLLNVEFPFDWDGLGKPWCGPAWLGCVFL